METRPPDLQGVARAWRLNVSEAVREAHRKEWGHDDAGIVTWMVNGPYHPFWSWWHVGVISLADIPGVPPANKQYPEAEYEFAVYSCEGNPNIAAVEAGDLKNRGFKLLQPPDVVFHFHGVTDEQAAEIGESAVKTIVQGQSCDSDFREWWMGSLATTVEHYVLGVHE